MSPILFVCAIAWQSPQSVSFSNVRFVTEDEQAIDISSGADLPGGVPGQILADFSFNSPLFDPTTSRYHPPRISTLWSLEDVYGSTVSAAPEGEWFGTRRPLPDLLIKVFDDATGVGVAELSIPVGKLVDISTNYPHLSDVHAVVRVACGLRSALAENDAGQPIGVSWQGDLSLDVTWPEVWLAQSRALVEANDSITCWIALRRPAATDRTFVISASVPTLVELSSAPVVVPAGSQRAEFEIVAREPGRYRLQASESMHAAIVSQRCLIVPDMFVASVASGSSSGGGSGGTGSGGAHGPEITHSNWRECEPAQPGTGTQTFTVCGQCVIGAPSLNCPDIQGMFYPASCSFAILTQCYPATTPMDTLVYQRINYYLVECGSGTGGGQIGSSSDGGHVSFGVTIKVNMRCCDYEAMGQSTVTQTVNTCTSIGGF